MLVCDKCNGKIIEGAKFCSHCGDPVTDADKTFNAIAESQEANVEISFGYSSSPNYQKAVDICNNIPTHKETGKDKQVHHTIILSITEIELILNLFELVGSWKSSRMLINGQIATKSTLVYNGIGCYRKMKKAYNPMQYCFGEKEYDFNLWGCQKLNMPLNEWGGGWLEYGQLDSKGIWHFDKERIKHELIGRNT